MSYINVYDLIFSLPLIIEYRLIMSADYLGHFFGCCLFDYIDSSLPLSPLETGWWVADV